MKTYFGIIGVVSLGFAAAVLVFWMSVSETSHKFPNHSRIPQAPGGFLLLALMVGVPAALGVGLLYLRKWAAVGASVAALYLAWLPVSGTFLAGPDGGTDLGFWFWLVLLLMISPSIMTVIYWRRLVWRGKWPHSVSAG